jgi:hypothetical protein
MIKLGNKSKDNEKRKFSYLTAKERQKLYEKENPKKHALYQGKETKAFKEWVIKNAKVEDPKNKNSIEILQPKSAISNKIDFSGNAWVQGPRAGEHFMWMNDGIYHIKHGNSRFPIYQWDNFEISEILYNKETKEKRYNLTFNGIIYRNYDRKRIWDLLNADAYVNGNKGPFSRLFTIYLIKYQVPQKQSANYCGFGEEGWRLPPHYTFPSIRDGIGQDILVGIEYMMKISTNKDDAITYFRDIYTATTIQYKDIIFAFFFAEIFAFSLKNHIGLQPILAIGSSNGGGKGKTKISTFLTTKIWNNLGDKEVLSIDNVSSSSRFFDYISATTFSIVIDDCTELGEDMRKYLKAHATSNTTVDRKNVNQDLQAKKVLKSSINLTFNDFPDWFYGSAFLERTLCLNINQQQNFPPKEGDTWRKLFNKIPKGYLGRYIIEVTKDWTGLKVQNLFDEQPQHSINTDRENLIYRFVHFGAQIIDILFNIRLDLQGLRELIYNTSKNVNQEIFDDFLNQLQSNSEIKMNHTKKGDYFAYTKKNLNNLKSRYKFFERVKSISSLEKLSKIVGKHIKCDLTKQRLSWMNQSSSVRMIRIYISDYEDYNKRSEV